MTFSIRAKLTLVIVAAALLLGQPIAGQVRKRTIPYPEWADQRDENEEVSLELVEIRVGGRSIDLGEPFEADANWLKNMTLIVKNIGKKSIAAFGVGGGLLEGVNEELPLGASFQYGVTWSFGKDFNPQKQKPPRIKLKPGETVTLTYLSVDPLTRSVLAKPGEGVFCKLKFMAPAIQYSDGTRNEFASAPLKFRHKIKRD